LSQPGAPLKEYQIATEVFGRAPAFDSHLDSTVRVQAGRLRGKLHEYYGSEGAEDPIVVDLPRGTYVLTFQHRPELASHAPAKARQERTRHSDNRPVSWAFVTVSALLAVAIIIIITLLARGKVSSGRAQVKAGVPVSLRVFWNRFTPGTDEPWVIFSNGSFVGRPEIGMRYFDPGRDSNSQVLDHYTGVGEVLAVHALDRVFAQLGHDIRVKRGSLFSLDDAENNDLIYIGSPAENLTLREISGTREFVFQRLTSGPRKGDLAIINRHPQPGEPSQFLASVARPLSEDYAIISLLPGLNPMRSVLILAGTTTLGTQAAVEYVCRQTSVEELLLRLSVSESGDLKPFEAILHVKVTRGVPVETQLVALRKLGS
jgi:hypothetical protein